MINPFCDGMPPRRVNDPKRIEENRILIAMAELLSNPPRLPHYATTHGPWDMRTWTCITCGRAKVEIHAKKLRCNP